ncbi:MAG: hypothetical protein WBE76_03425 [Terracidiphilus sp.]
MESGPVSASKQPYFGAIVQAEYRILILLDTRKSTVMLKASHHLAPLAGVQSSGIRRALSGPFHIPEIDLEARGAAP